MVSSNAPIPNSNNKNEQIKPAHKLIKRVIGVMSAKGGVGKSFVTGFLAHELTKAGYKVGILDADFAGSSIPMMFGLHGPAKTGQYSFLPLQSDSGIKIISMNSLFNNENQSIIWKESLVVNVIKELWEEVEWGTLDYLLVDLPPATSEAAVAIMRSLPFAGMVIITMPQRISAKLVRKAVYVAQKIGVHILGVVENMVYFLNPETGTKQYIFGQCHGESLANIAKAPILAQIPLDPIVAKKCDVGKIEDVILDAGSEFIELFLESLLAIEEKESQGSETESKRNTGNEFKVVEEINNRGFSLYQADSAGKAFSEIAIHLIRSKENMGVLDHPDAQGHFMGKCGDRMQIDLQIIDGRIIEAKFMADGCGATLACGSMITKMACSKTMDQAGKISSEDLLTALGGLPDDHQHCAELAVMTLREAVIDAVEGYGKPKR
jgi:Mrp family chromosome partitioning ATPase/NifU-like protein involved in Fe-S cluster formation